MGKDNNKKGKKWVHPAEDPEMDQEMYMNTANWQDDPRTGDVNFSRQVTLPKTCQKGHPAMTSEETLTVENYFEFGGNMNGRWIDCKGCGCRLAYWPRKGCSGKYRVHTHPEVVWEAFVRIEKEKLSPDKKTVAASIATVEADLKLQAQRRLQEKKKQEPQPQEPPDSNHRHRQNPTGRSKGYFKLAGDVLGTRSRSSDDSSAELLADADGEMDAESTVRTEIAQMEAVIQQLREQLESQGLELAKKGTTTGSVRSKSRPTSATRKSGGPSSSRMRRVVFSKSPARTRETESPAARSKSPARNSGQDSATDQSWEKMGVTGETRDD